MKPTGKLRFARRDGDPHPVLQQQMLGFLNEVWEKDVLISTGSNEQVLQWVDVVEEKEES